jgi:hypothetical protein
MTVHLKIQQLMNKLFFFSLLVLSMISCSKKESNLSSLNKSHSIEITFETKQLADSSVLLTTKQNVYLKGTLVKTMIKTDTLPYPGDSLQTIETETAGKSQVRIPKEYEFFVTIK